MIRIFSLVLLLATTNLYAQFDPDTAKSKLNVFGAFHINSAKADKDFVVYTGLSAGLHHQSGIYVGLWGSIKSTEVKGNFYPYLDYYYELMHGGAFAGYEITKKYTFNPVVLFYAGIGEFSLVNADGKVHKKTDYIILKPTLEMEAIVSEYIRISLGLNYQYFSGTNKLESFDDSMFKTIGGEIVFRFGIP